MEYKEIIISLIKEFYKKYGINKFKEHDKWNLFLIRYYNFRLKLIPNVQWHIQVSPNVTDKINKKPELSVPLVNLMKKMSMGNDINPHQSKTFFNVDYHDMLFNDWGIHHLHLNNDKKNEGDYFVNRSGPLLFVRFYKNCAYLIDILNHSDNDVWANKNMINIIQQNWPKTIESSLIKNAEFTVDYNDHEIFSLRSKGITTGLNINGKSYILLGHGFACSGDNMMATRMANEVQRWCHKNEDLLNTNPDLFKQNIKKQLYL